MSETKSRDNGFGSQSPYKVTYGSDLFPKGIQSWKSKNKTLKKQVLREYTLGLFQQRYLVDDREMGF